jgi:hypothetical protein
MVTQQDYVDQAHRAARELATAVGKLDRSLADSIGLRQLAADVARICRELDTLTGHASTSPGVTGAVHDTDYDPRIFVDGAPDVPSHHRN